jgi:hypothetical protein
LKGLFDKGISRKRLSKPSAPHVVISAGFYFFSVSMEWPADCQRRSETVVNLAI